VKADLVDSHVETKIWEETDTAWKPQPATKKQDKFQTVSGRSLCIDRNGISSMPGLACHPNRAYTLIFWCYAREPLAPRLVLLA